MNNDMIVDWECTDCGYRVGVTCTCELTCKQFSQWVFGGVLDIWDEVAV